MFAPSSATPCVEGRESSSYSDFSFDIEAILNSVNSLPPVGTKDISKQTPTTQDGPTNPSLSPHKPSSDQIISDVPRPTSDTNTESSSIVADPLPHVNSVNGDGGCSDGGCSVVPITSSLSPTGEGTGTCKEQPADSLEMVNSTENSLDKGNEREGREDVNAVGGDVNTVGGNVNAVGGDVNTVGGDVNAVGGDVNAVGGDVNTVGGDINAVGGDVNAVGGDVNAVDGDINTMGRSINTVGEDLNTVGGDIDAVDEDVNTVGGGIKTFVEKRRRRGTFTKDDEEEERGDTPTSHGTPDDDKLSDCVYEPSTITPDSVPDPDPVPDPEPLSLPQTVAASLSNSSVSIVNSSVSVVNSSVSSDVSLGSLKDEKLPDKKKQLPKPSSIRCERSVCL